MANQRIERQLEYLKSLRAAGPSNDAIQSLRKLFTDRTNVVVAKAAGLAIDWNARSLLPVILEAYIRLFLKASETDPQCWGKNELARCLKEFGVAESAVFLRGLHHHQWESTWGGKSDTATVLRATCALALVQCTDMPRHEILLNLVDAITDSDAGVRSDAARAMEQMGGREVSLLLRLKARAGDQEARVTGQILESLLSLEGSSAVSFVQPFLDTPNAEISEEAALALGASRLPEAVETLQTVWLNTGHIRNGTTLLRAISASRQDSALHFLLEQVKTALLPTAQDALWALQLHRDSEQIVQRIRQAVSERPELTSLFHEIYTSRR